jgi:hypothetical protein
VIHGNSCYGRLQVSGHEIEWDLRYGSRFSTRMSNKGWIGFSVTPHSDAVFSGSIRFDEIVSAGELLGTGIQGHNCGVRHRHFWTWLHAYFPAANGEVSTLEALCYEMPLGLTFRKVALWHAGHPQVFRKVHEIKRDRTLMVWEFAAQDASGNRLEVRTEAPKLSTHRLPYFRTDCSGSFEVTNNSLANVEAQVRLGGQESLVLSTLGGAVLEMAGEPR